MAVDRNETKSQYENRRSRSLELQLLDWKVDRVLENEARKLFKRERDGIKQS